MFILLHRYCHRGFGCGKMITFTLKIFNILGDVYTRDGTISLCQRDASAQIVVSHNYPTQVLGSILFTPSVVTKWHDRHRYLSIHHVPYLMSLSSPRHCSKTLTHLLLVLHICISESGQHWFNNGLLPIWRQVIIQTSAGILSIGLLETNFSEILIKIQNFSFKKTHFKSLSRGRWVKQC